MTDLKEKWVIVHFNTYGYETVITSIPESQVKNAIKYLESNGYKDITNLKVKQ